MNEQEWIGKASELSEGLVAFANAIDPPQFAVLPETRQDAAPVGWKLVPIEPTEQMVRAALDCQEADPEDGPSAEVYHTYIAMLAASPSSAALPVGEVDSAGVAIPDGGQQ